MWSNLLLATLKTILFVIKKLQNGHFVTYVGQSVGDFEIFTVYKITKIFKNVDSKRLIIT